VIPAQLLSQTGANHCAIDDALLNSDKILLEQSLTLRLKKVVYMRQLKNTYFYINHE
jgi:hypothetical protein